MSGSDLAQLQMFAQIDELVRRLSEWANDQTAWEPLIQSRAMIRRLLARVETLKIRLEAPLVVATFGGTGTGKSALVNALVGQECTTTGRQRPTTRQPVLIAHSSTELEAFGLPLDEFEIVRRDTEALRDILLVDCPDPDTSDDATQGSNLERLRRLLPHCDVLIYTSTQQKYRSARVVDELGQAATGCRLIFVQTHADIDEDIRDDWRKQLQPAYEVPDVFFIDSLRALEEQTAGQRPSGDFSRLQDLLGSRLAASERVQIRRANLIDLMQDALDHCRTQLAPDWPGVQQLEAILEEQRSKLTNVMSIRLRDELKLSMNLWERRLLGAVTQIWGFSPFSSMLRLYNGLGSLIASASLYRARSSAQLALIGALQGTRWLTARRKQKEAEDHLDRLSSCGLDDSVLRESQLVVAGYVHEAKLDMALVENRTIDGLRGDAAVVEEQFLGDASRRIDAIINDLASKKSGLLTRLWYEFLFLAYVGFVLFRIGSNFFYDSMVNSESILSIDFYVPAGVFFVLWSGLLVMMFTRRLRRGLSARIDVLANELAQSRVSSGLFPELESACRQVQRQREQLDALSSRTSDLRHQIAISPGLGAPSISVEPSLAVHPGE